MVRFTGGFLLFTACALAAPADRAQAPRHAQQVLLPTDHRPPTPPRKLQGRFLHITDIHPDPFYTPGTATGSDHACHSGRGDAGPYGAPVTDCDAPFSLVNATFQWINDHLKDTIDFVIWTGDSARHDNDEVRPRTEKQVVDLNVYIVNKFVDVFGKDDHLDDPDPTNDFLIPIVPNFGNNDILPHNIFTPGPNKWTRKYASIWDRFVPEEQRHSFARGGWFFIEVIPDELAVFSVNTLYFFDSNAAVDGCEAKSEPGYEHMEWLRIQLQFLRQRGMKAIMTGHVPPARTESKTSWDETCWQKWTLWMRLYRDVVVGSVFGHMNIDHFLFQDVKQLTDKFGIKDDEHSDVHDAVRPSRRGNPGRGSGEDFTTAAKAAYLTELRDGWSSLPAPPKGLSWETLDEDSKSDQDMADSEGLKTSKKSKKQRQKEKFLKNIGGPWAERYSLDLVSPSVVPNFFPTLRVVEYNISGLEGKSPASRQREQVSYKGDPVWLERTESDDEKLMTEDSEEGDEDEDEDEEVADEPEKEMKNKKKKHGKKKTPKKPGFPVPRAPSKAAPPGPAYSPQTLTFLGYSQYYANLTRINAATAQPDKTQKKPKEVFEYEMEYNTRNDTAQGGGKGWGYGMTDLTVRQWIVLAERIGRESFKGEVDDVEDDDDEREGAQLDRNDLWDEPGRGRAEKEPKNHLWRTFVKRAFVGTRPDEELEDRFG